MTRSKWWVVLALAALVAVGNAPVVAQTQPADTGYTVERGDTLYALRGIYRADQPEMRALVILNSFLAERGRTFTDAKGRFIVILKPGEVLDGIERLGVTVDPVTIDEFRLAPARVTQAGTDADARTEPAAFDWMRTALYVLVALAAIAAIMALATWSRRRRDQATRREEHERELQQDPITSGTPYVPGGIPATEPQRLEDFFEQQAVARYADRNPHVDRNTVRVTRVGPIESGTISGEGLVGYLGGEMRPRRIATPLNAYQARYRFPDGTEELLQCLQACMNPVAYGGDVYRGFTFTPATAVVAPPEPPQPVPQAVPHPAMAARRIREATEAEGGMTITVGDRVFTFERGVHLAVDPETGAVTIDGTGFRTVIMRRAAKAKKVGASRTPAAAVQQ